MADQDSGTPLADRPSPQTSPAVIGLGPNPALVDERVHLTLRGLDPGVPVTVRAHMDDELGRTWSSWARYRANPRGEVDVAAQPADDGTYRGTDFSGLFWSMQLDRGRSDRSPFPHASASPLTMTFRAEIDGRAIAGAQLDRPVMGPGVRRTPVRARGLVGTFFQPADAEPRPGILVMGGSEGGLQEPRAALLASHGYAALALAYFRYETLPAELWEIPLEYFEAAIEWLRAQPSVRPDRVVVMGASRGGELALLLGARFPQVAGVVAYVPGSVVFGGFPTGPSPRAAWTWRGQPVEYLPRTRSEPPASPAAAESDTPTAMTPRFLAALADADAVARVAIPVERIRGPVLVVSGSDDQLWPSPVMAEMVVTRLAAHRHPYPFRHFSAHGAGHVLKYPYLPTTVDGTRHAVSGQVLLRGGTPEANAFGQAAAWADTLAFLRDHVG